jgi:hypothetical protein
LNEPAHFYLNKKHLCFQDIFAQTPFLRAILASSNAQCPEDSPILIPDIDNKGVVHQIISPISNYESTIFKRIFIMIFNRQTEKKQIRSLFSFSIAQTEKKSWKKLVKQIGEII